jgi:glycosyltransferase involved in cell wall biosynthesis
MPTRRTADLRSPARAQPTVSVILPTYQRAWCLARSLASVLGQTYADFELIVVDDGSTDGTAGVVAGFADPRVRYVRLESNRGAGAARNAGARRANGRFLAFQDSDDEWMPAKLERHLCAFETCGADVAVVYSDMERIPRDGDVRYHLSPSLTPGVLLDPVTRFYQVCKLGIQSTVIRRECFEEVGGFDEAFPALEDLELFIRLSRRVRFHHLQEPLVRYHETDGISSDTAAKLVARRRLLRLYRRHLLRDDPTFVIREAASLREAEERGTGRRERLHVQDRPRD